MTFISRYAIIRTQSTTTLAFTPSSMRMLHDNPAKLYLGDSEFCNVYDWTYLGVIGYQPNGRRTSSSAMRKVWSMLCDCEPRGDDSTPQQLKRGDETVQIVIESARPSRIDDKTYSLVKFTTDEGARFGRIG